MPLAPGAEVFVFGTVSGDLRPHLTYPDRLVLANAGRRWRCAYYQGTRSAAMVVELLEITDHRHQLHISKCRPLQAHHSGNVPLRCACYTSHRQLQLNRTTQQGLMGYLLRWQCQQRTTCWCRRSCLSTFVVAAICTFFSMCSQSNLSPRETSKWFHQNPFGIN